VYLSPSTTKSKQIVYTDSTAVARTLSRVGTQLMPGTNTAAISETIQRIARIPRLVSSLASACMGAGASKKEDGWRTQANECPMAERHGDNKRDDAPIIVPQRDPSHVAPHEVASKR
jgi:hypothetical protein